jgi:hypothetical protein
MIKHGVRTYGSGYKATKNTVFKVTYFKEALSIGSNGSPIRALRTKERSGL